MIVPSKEVKEFCKLQISNIVSSRYRGIDLPAVVAHAVYDRKERIRQEVL
jgi:hypothetical protein